MALHLEPCTTQEVCASLGGTVKLLDELRERLQDWLKLQPHLPQDIPTEILEHFILGTKLSLEQSKHKLDMFFTMKTFVPEILMDRDPLQASLARMHKVLQIAYLPKLTPEKYRVCVLRPIADDYSELNPYDSCKYVLMMDHLLMNDAKNRSVGNVYILDHTHITLGFIAKYGPSVIKKSEVTITQAHAQRIKALYHVNVAPVTEALLAIFKRALSAKLTSRTQVFNKGNLELLQQYLPKSILPEDFGGDELPMDRLAELWQQKLIEKRDWFLEQEKFTVDESLRPGETVDRDNLFGFAGAFRQLDVD